MKNLSLAADALRAVFAAGGRPVDAIAAAAFLTGESFGDTANALIRSGALVVVNTGGDVTIECR